MHTRVCMFMAQHKLISFHVFLIHLIWLCNEVTHFRVNIRKSRKMASTQGRGKPSVGCPRPSKQLKTLLTWDPNGCFFMIPWKKPLRASDNNTFYLYGRALAPYCLCIFELPIYFSSLALGQFTDPVS